MARKTNMIEGAMRSFPLIMFSIILVIAIGIYALPNLNKNEFPNVSISQGVVAIVYPGATAEEIEEQVENNEVSPENATLLTDGKLWQYLAYATCLEGLPFIWSHFSEVGISLGKSDNSDSVTLKDLTYIEAHLRRQTEYLKDSVKNWLCEHQESFPLMDCCACGCSCCQSNSMLNMPNPMIQVYSPKRRCTKLK